MKSTKTYWTLIFLCLSQLGFGQATSQFLVLYANQADGIVYTVDGEQRRVYQGQNYPSQGSFQLENGSWLNLLYAGQKRRLDGPGKIDLSGLAESMEQQPKGTFLGRFFRFIGNSVDKTEDSDHLEKYYREFLTNARAAIKGFGTQEVGIGGPTYFSGFLADPIITFRWDSVGTTEGYRFEIRNRDNGAPVLSVRTNSNMLTLHLEELQLIDRLDYEWQVFANVDEKQQASQAFPFVYDPAEIDAFIEALAMEDDYEDLEDYEWPLLIVFKMEEASFLHPAYEQYKFLIDLEPDNQLYKKLFAAFLVRMNDYTQASKMINP